MLVKAIIEQIIDNYSARIRIPIFHKSANSPYCTNFNDLPIASICTIPGLSLVLKVGDVVYVDFEKDEKDLPVIMGVLAKPDIKSSCDISAQSLSVDISCNLPEDIQLPDKYKQKINNFESVFSTMVELSPSKILPRGRVLGDVNGDGVINQDDVDLVSDIASHRVQPSALQTLCADINLSGDVNNSDAAQLNLYVNGSNSVYYTNAKDFCDSWNFDADLNKWWYDMTCEIDTSDITGIRFADSYEVLSETEIRVYFSVPPIDDLLIDDIIEISET